MFLHEFQAKELLQRYGVAVPRGRIAGSAEDARQVARRMGFSRYAVKAQVRAGSRARAGGVRFADSPEAVGREAADLLGRRLVTAGTGPAGRLVRWVFVEQAIVATREIYLGLTIDPSGAVLALASAHGGSSVEVDVEADQQRLLRTSIDPATAPDASAFAAMTEALGLHGAIAEAANALLVRLTRAFLALDATLIELNPLAVTEAGTLVALDAKIVIDDNALPRHADLARLRRLSEEEDGDPVELAASDHELNYLSLDGDIGIAVNGAGLALATLDMVRDAGGRPANFMDIRTTASTLDIAAGFDLILANPRVRVVLVNVHGGGMQRCDTIAEGLGIASRRAGRVPPLVMRFAGNNADFALTRLATYGVPFAVATDMGDAVRRAVALTSREAV